MAKLILLSVDCTCEGALSHDLMLQDQCREKNENEERISGNIEWYQQ